MSQAVEALKTVDITNRLPAEVEVLAEENPSFMPMDNFLDWTVTGANMPEQVGVEVAQVASGRGHVENDTNVRSSKGTDTEIITTLSSRSSFDLLVLDGEWYRVRLSDGREGFILAELVKVDTPIPVAAPEAPTENLDTTATAEAPLQFTQELFATATPSPEMTPTYLQSYPEMIRPFIEEGVSRGIIRYNTDIGAFVTQEGRIIRQDYVPASGRILTYNGSTVTSETLTPEQMLEMSQATVRSQYEFTMPNGELFTILLESSEFSGPNLAFTSELVENIRSRINQYPEKYNFWAGKSIFLSFIPVVEETRKSNSNIPVFVTSTDNNFPSDFGFEVPRDVNLPGGAQTENVYFPIYVRSNDAPIIPFDTSVQTTMNQLTYRTAIVDTLYVIENYAEFEANVWTAKSPSYSIYINRGDDDDYWSLYNSLPKVINGEFNPLVLVGR